MDSKKRMSTGYHPGNYQKYMTKNPLKRKMVARLNGKLLRLVSAAVREVGGTQQDQPVRILDAGCGEGFVSGLLYRGLREENVEITGLELTEEAIEKARAMNPEIPFVQGDVLKMPFESRSFDIVLCTEVLEHLEDPGAALRELLRVTGVSLIVTVPHEPWFRMGNLLVLKNVTRLGDPIDHINHWSYSGFAAFLKVRSGERWEMDRSFPWTVASCSLKNEAAI